jgi:hypothetical protein
MASLVSFGAAAILLLTPPQQALEQDRHHRIAAWIRAFGDEPFTPATLKQSADSLARLYPQSVFVLFAGPTMDDAAATQCNCMSHSDFATVKGRVESTSWALGANPSLFARLQSEGLEVLHVWPSFHRMASLRATSQSPHGPATTMPLLRVELFLRAAQSLPDANRCHSLACSLQRALSLSCPLTLLIRQDSWFAEPEFPLAYPFDLNTTLSSVAEWHRRPSTACSCSQER